MRIRERHRELVQTQVKQFDGEVVDATGDESLSIFPSALRAVDCALALQGALRSDPDLRLRIGIHLGDVLRRGGEVIGEGVNVAARIRPLAEAGGICVSEPVYQTVRSRAHIRARLLGAQALKNVALPVPVYALMLAEADEALGRAKPRRRVQIAALLGIVLVAAGLAAANRDSMRLNESISRDLRPPLRRLREGFTIMVETRDIMSAWIAMIEDTGIDCSPYAAARLLEDSDGSAPGLRSRARKPRAKPRATRPKGK